MRWPWRKRRRVVTTIHLSREALDWLANPEQNPGESRQGWKDRTFMQRYGGGPSKFSDEIAAWNADADPIEKL